MAQLHCTINSSTTLSRGAPLFLLNRFFSVCSARLSFLPFSRSFARPLSSRSRSCRSLSLSSLSPSLLLSAGCMHAQGASDGEASMSLTLQGVMTDVETAMQAKSRSKAQGVNVCRSIRC